MAANDFENEPDLSQWLAFQEASIGFNRDVYVVAKNVGLTFYVLDESGKRKYMIKLTPTAVKVMNNFMTEILTTIEAWLSGRLSNTFKVPLGGRVFLEINQKYRCVSIRRFFRPKGDPSLLLPSPTGIGLKFEEFERLRIIWPEFMHYINLSEVQCCEFNDPNEHTECKTCFY